MSSDNQPAARGHHHIQTMKIEEKFNRRSAELIEVQPPSITASPYLALGMKMKFFRTPGSGDLSTLSMHLTPEEALALAEHLISIARRAITCA